jgi:hypothetical protein
MSTLVGEQLDATLTQSITTTRPLQLAGIRPSLYVHNVPAGTFYFRVYSGATLIKEYSFTSASAKTAVGTAHNYFWVDLPLTGALGLDVGTYSIKFESSGYTISESAYIVWLKDWAKLRENALGTPSDFTEYPYAFNLIEYGAREF